MILKYSVKMSKLSYKVGEIKMGYIKNLYFKPMHVDYMKWHELLIVIFGFPFFILYGIWKCYVTKAWAYEMEIEENLDIKHKEK